MIGTHYWSTGILACSVDGAEWAVSLRFLDDGFCDHGSTQGELRCRYLTPDVVAAVRLLRADAERMGIRWRTVADELDIYVYAAEPHPGLEALAAEWGWHARHDPEASREPGR